VEQEPEGFLQQKRKLLYANKERIQNLIEQQQRNLADVNYLDLNSVTKKEEEPLGGGGIPISRTE